MVTNQDDNTMLASLTLRLSMTQRKWLVENSGRGKTYPTMSDAARDLFDHGIQIKSMLKIYNDPAKKAEFMEKVSWLKDLEAANQTVQTMSREQIEAYMFLLSNQKEKIITQMVLDM